MDKTKEYISMCEKAVEIQRGWKSKKVYIGDTIFVKYLVETIFITREPIFSNDKDEGGCDREYIQFEETIPSKVLLIKVFAKEAFYKYDDGELNVIWLPRQDQLQEMYDNGQGFTHQNLEHFFRWYKSGIGQFSSMEQLWLVFVMSEKYNKIWNGKDWEG